MNANCNVYLALLQIFSTLIGQELPSPVALMFNKPVRDLMPKLIRLPILFNNNDDHYAALIEGSKILRKKDTSKSFPCLPEGSAVAVQRIDGGSWAYGTVVEHGSKDHNCRSYKIQVIKMGRIITRMQ